jgi:hypothetical protein
MRSNTLHKHKLLLYLYKELGFIHNVHKIHYHLLTQDMLNFAYVINISQGCNNLIRITWGCNKVCRITWGRGNMDFSKWWSEILHEIECLVFHNYFVFFGGEKSLPELTFSGPISSHY